jgi:hypothetical protein
MPSRQTGLLGIGDYVCVGMWKVLILPPLPLLAPRRLELQRHPNSVRNDFQLRRILLYCLQCTGIAADWDMSAANQSLTLLWVETVRVCGRRHGYALVLKHDLGLSSCPVGIDALKYGMFLLQNLQSMVYLLLILRGQALNTTKSSPCVLGHILQYILKARILA